MNALMRETNAYRLISGYAAGELPHAVLVLFPDEKYLRALMSECAVAFFGAEGRRARLIREETFSDCRFYPAAGGKLTAEDVAAIIDESQLRPVEEDRKLFVLPEFHNATPLLQNKLLKLLEEPPAGVHFLLGAASEFSVLPTVLSRVRKIAEPPFPEEKIAATLGRMHGGKEGIARAAAASGGVLSLAETLLGEEEDFALAERFLSGEDVALCRSLEGKGNGQAFFAALRLILRDMLFLKTGQGRYAATDPARISALAESYPAGAIVSAIAKVSEAERNVKYNANVGQAAYALALALREEKEKWQK